MTTGFTEDAVDAVTCPEESREIPKSESANPITFVARVLTFASATADLSVCWFSIINKSSPYETTQ
ncbi:hypothetical protein [Candidatus Planktophila sulfonica]|uniref:hypothetical protein n=1 Tax=Candidatus Planktophila sulfonica TaxID=1884904 RepID=UPI00167FE352|nr:hypothetical protein [Candidatus Planktophila sulfonica]